MRTQSSFSIRIRSLAFISAIFLMCLSAAPSAMAREGNYNPQQIAQNDNADPGCD